MSRQAWAEPIDAETYLPETVCPHADDSRCLPSRRAWFWLFGDNAGRTGHCRRVIEIGGRHIRLFGIRAPALAETCRAGGEAWPCGKAALDWLKGYLEDREVACRERGRDEYGRMVAVCYVGGENLSGTLAREGWALNNPADGMDYAGAEEEAHLAGRGMWKGSGERP